MVFLTLPLEGRGEPWSLKRNTTVELMGPDKTVFNEAETMKIWAIVCRQNMC